jgi:hypothetical protein
VPPEVRFVAAVEMACRCLGAFLYSTRVTGYGTTVPTSVRLFVSKEVDLRDAYGHSILLHELAHALQTRVRIKAMVSA